MLNMLNMLSCNCRLIISICKYTFNRFLTGLAKKMTIKKLRLLLDKFLLTVTFLLLFQSITLVTMTNAISQNKNRLLLVSATEVL